MSHDSRTDTYEHKAYVLRLMRDVIDELLDRAVNHDDSKLSDPERAGFDEWSGRLAEVEYGSPEYHHALEQMRPFLEQHYMRNPHHPEFHPGGVADMTLIDVLEMLCDWKASTLRGKNGDLARSIRQNRERFGYGEEFERLLMNTAREMAWTP